MDFQDITLKLIILAMLTRYTLQDCYRKQINLDNCVFKLKFNQHMCYRTSTALKCTNLNFKLSKENFDYSGNQQEVLIEITDGEVSLELSSGLFRSLPNAVYIGIHRNNITVMEPGVFNSLPNLKTLNMSNNYIETLPDGVFSSLYDLWALDLSENEIECIKDSSLLGMHDLKELYLNNNKLSNMSGALGSCESLTHLDLSNNHIEDLSDINNCVNLNYFDISQNHIRNFTKDVFEGTSLIYFDISYNDLDYVEGDNLKNFFMLEILNLSGNPLFSTKDPAIDLFQSTPLLNTLNLSSTSLKRLGVGTFGRLRKLEVLDLSRNSLVYLPKGLFQDVILLRKLYINNNHLSYFRFDSFVALQEINLDYNLWNCDKLSDIMKYRKNTVLIRGDTYNDTNVYGIGCKEDLKEDVNVVEYSNTTSNTLQTEYLLNIMKTQENMTKAFIELKDTLIQISTNKANESSKDLLILMEKLLNQSNHNQRYYQDTFQKQQLDLQELWSKIMNTTNTLNSQNNVTEFVYNITNTDIIKNIFSDLKEPLEGIRLQYQNYIENVQNAIKENILDIRNSLTSEKSQTQPLLNINSDQSQVKSYEDMTGRNSDTAALYCIFIVLLLILAIFVTLFILHYKKYNRFKNTSEESNPLSSLLI